MRRAQISLRAVVLVVLAGWAWSTTGCTHNHYYGAAMPVACAEPPVAATVVSGRYGAVCEVPTQVVGGTVVSQPAGAPTIVANSPRPSRVLVSEPGTSSVPQRGAGRFAWRRSDPESITTKIDGGEIHDDTVSR